MKRKRKPSYIRRLARRAEARERLREIMFRYGWYSAWNGQKLEPQIVIRCEP